MRIDPDAIAARRPNDRGVAELAAEVKRQAAVIDSLRAEVRTQRLEIAGLREERRAVIAADRPQPDRPEEMDNTPARNGTLSPDTALSGTGQSVETGIPPEWLQRPYWVDPPSGWAYGFPRLYDPAKDGDMTEWMIANGYPERLARQGLPCTFRSAE